MTFIKGDYTRSAVAIASAQELDRAWLASPAGRDGSGRYTPWMPFPLFDFIAMTAEALPDIQGPRFLEIGCGIGTRMLIAQEVFGLDVQGIDRVPEYLDEAAKLRMDVLEIDAMDFSEYGEYDLLWFNRPFLDPALQLLLEAKVWNEMRSGGVVMCANLEAKPPPTWWIVLDDWEVRRGIWRKP
jgi:hypothetical protein